WSRTRTCSRRRSPAGTCSRRARRRRRPIRRSTRPLQPTRRDTRKHCCSRWLRKSRTRRRGSDERVVSEKIRRSEERPSQRSDRLSQPPAPEEAPQMKTATDTFTEQDLKEMIEVRRDLHAHPELAFDEVRTSGLVAKRLTALGLEPRTGVGKTG